MTVNHQPENLDGTPQHLSSTRAPPGRPFSSRARPRRRSQAPFQLNGS